MPDFGFVGPAYQAANPDQDRQVCVNWYVEIDPNKEAKTPTALLSVPGKVSVATCGTGPVRGAYTLPGGTQAVIASGNGLYLMTVNTAAGTAPATFTTAYIGPLATSAGVVVMQDNGAGGSLLIVDGTNGYIYTLSTGTLAQITDSAFLGADRVEFLDGFLIFNRPASQTFYTTHVYSVLPFDGTYYALKDHFSDNLVTIKVHNAELWLVGEVATEVWYNAGGATFPFARIPGAALQIGCAAKHSIARLGGQALVWLANSERGQNTVIMTQGYQYKVISTRAIEYALSTYPVISDAIGWTYFDVGHEFYVLTFPAQDVTWVYDATSDLWHQRASYDPVAGVFHRDTANCYFQFQDQRLVGDKATGTVYRLDRTVYTDGSLPLVAWRRTPHIWKDRQRVFHESLQIEFLPGVGNAAVANPQIMVSWSNDGGRTYSQVRNVPIGLIGQYQNRAITRRLGWARDRIYDVRISDAVPRDVVGATLIVDVEE